MSLKRTWESQNPDTVSNGSVPLRILLTHVFLFFPIFFYSRNFLSGICFSEVEFCTYIDDIVY